MRTFFCMLLSLALLLPRVAAAQAATDFPNPRAPGARLALEGAAPETLSADTVLLRTRKAPPGSPRLPGRHGPVRLATTEWGTPVNLSNLNTSAFEGPPAISADGLTIVFSSTGRGGEGNEDIFIAFRDSVDDDFGAPSNLGDSVNSPWWDAMPCLSNDGLELFFASTPVISGSSTDWDLYLAVRNDTDDPFTTVYELNEINIEDVQDTDPWISDDNLLLFLSDQSNIYYTERSTRDGLFGTVYAYESMNSEFRDFEFSIRSDYMAGQLSSFRAGNDDPDIYEVSSDSPSEEFGAPERVNTLRSGDAEGGASVTADGRFVFFYSDRSGGEGSYDLWMAERLAPTPTPTASPTPTPTPSPTPTPGPSRAEPWILYQ